MKNFMASISRIMLLAFSASIYAAGGGTVPPPSGGGGDSAPEPDARQIAWLLISQNPAVQYNAGICFNYMSPGMTTPLRVNGYGIIQKFGPRTEDIKWTKLVLNEKTIIDSENPQNGFPMGTGEGVISDFMIWMAGYDAQGQTTCFTVFTAKSLAPLDPIVFVLKPYMRSAEWSYQPKDWMDHTKLRMYLKNSKGDVVCEAWYVDWKKGFGLMFDPLAGPYTWSICYLDGNGVQLLESGNFEWGNSQPKGGNCPVQLKYLGGVNMAELVNNCYFPDGPVQLNASIEGGTSAYVMAIELQGDEYAMWVTNFVGKVEIRRADDPDRNPLLDPPFQEFNFDGSNYSQYGQIWRGLKKVIITFTGYTKTPDGIGFGIYWGTIPSSGGLG